MPRTLSAVSVQPESGLKQRAAKAGVNIAYDSPFEGWRAAYYEDVHRVTRFDYSNGRFVTTRARDKQSMAEDDEIGLRSPSANQRRQFHRAA